MALALRAAFGVRVCSPANAVGFRSRCAWAVPGWQSALARSR